MERNCKMEFSELIEKRRSIRSYDQSKKVTKQQIEECVHSAIQAPSWKNLQTSRYYCILDEKKVQDFANKCLPEFNINNSNGASLVVTTFVKNVVGFNKETHEPVNECGNGWGYYDLGLHNENFILKAKDMGLDTLIMGIRNGEAIRAFLNIPDTEEVVSVIAVGYATKEVVKPKRKEVGDICKFI